MNALPDLPAIEQLNELGARFVLWRHETRNGRSTKVPLRVNGLTADSTRSSSWNTLAECLKAADTIQAAGVGFVLAAERDQAAGKPAIVGADLDGCRDPRSGAIEPRAQEVIEALASYAEVSPSGTGVKVFCFVNPVPRLEANKLVLAKANGTGKDLAIEVYVTGRYFALTGQHLDGTPDEITDATEAFERLVARVARESGTRASKANDSTPAADGPPSDATMRLIQAKPNLKALWEGRKEKGDLSASGLDWSLAGLLGWYGLPAEEILRVLKIYPHGQIGSGKIQEKEADRRLGMLLTEATKRANDRRERDHARARERAEAEEARAKRPERDWRDLLHAGEGAPYGHEANVAVALRHAPELAGRLRLNLLAERVEGTSLPWRSAEGWRAWTDTDDVALAVWLQERGLPKVKPSIGAAAVQLVAGDRPHHPLREFLDGLAWDGTERLNTWLTTYLGAKAEPGRETYLEQVGRKSLIQTVARAYRPGCKADHMPVLRGPQGVGKSTAIRILAVREEWFADEIADLGSKDAAQDLAGKWVIEVPELAAIRGREIERTKAFMSRKVDHYRPSYGRRSIDHPRQCMFFGTTNADSYLQDETGNRRNWDIGVGTIDLDALRRDRDQLWAEAVAAYKAGETWWLGKDVETLAAKVQADRRVVDVWEEKLLDWAEGRAEPFGLGEALTEALFVPIERQGRAEQMRVSAILKANGFTRTRAGGGDRPWRYERKKDPSNRPDDNPGGGAEVGTDGVGWDEVGTPKTQRSQQSSQPSQPFSKSPTAGRNGTIRAPTDPAYRSVGNRLGRRDGWDGDAQPYDNKGQSAVPTSRVGLGRGKGWDGGCSDETEDAAESSEFKL